MTRRIVEPTLLDRALAAVAPDWGLRRLRARAQFNALTGGYTGARKSRRATRNWSTSAGSADADIIPDLPALRERSRDLARNTPIATGALGRMELNVVGPGLRVSPQIDRRALGLEDEVADEWERRAAFLFDSWAGDPDCDASAHQDFHGLQALAFRSVLESGDCFAVPLMEDSGGGASGLRVRLYEADQVSTPMGKGREGSKTEGDNRILDGVEIDASARPVAYHFAMLHPGDISGRSSREWTRVEARNGDGARQVWHLFDRRRIGQTRGVPMLAPVVESLKQLGNYAEAELMAAVIGAMITVVYKGTAEPLPNTDPNDPAYSSTSSDDAAREYRMKSGTVMEIEHDADVSVPTLGRPNSGFDEFFVAIVRQIGAAMDIPFEVLIMHFTASYSASRAALEMAWQTFRKHRIWLARSFCRPAYEMRIAEAVALGQLPAPGFFADPLVRSAWLGAEWIGPRRISLDPKKENEADAIAADRGWKSDSEITAETTGGNWERKLEQRAREKRMREEAGLAVPARTPPALPPAREDDDEDEEDEE